MKKAIRKTIHGFLVLAMGSLAITSCTKEQNNSPQTVHAKLPPEDMANASSEYSNCGPVPQELEPPAENKLALQAYATGVQIYQVRRNTADPNLIQWVNIAPSANLYARPDLTSQLAIHYAGPTWEFSKGRFKDDKVVGSKLKGITVDPTAVQWLLLKAVDSLSSPGNKITYIQRVCTTGGLPPSTPTTESNLGALDSIPYTASYRFYVKDL
jgi:hypothetical protein